MGRGPKGATDWSWAAPKAEWVEGVCISQHLWKDSVQAYQWVAKKRAKGQAGATVLMLCLHCIDVDKRNMSGAEPLFWLIWFCLEVLRVQPEVWLLPSFLQLEAVLSRSLVHTRVCFLSEWVTWVHFTCAFLGILKSFSKASEDPFCLPTITWASVFHRLKTDGSEPSTLF